MQPIRKVTAVVFDDAPLGILSFAVGVFDLAIYYRAVEGISLRIVAGQRDAASHGGGLSVTLPYDLDAIRQSDLVLITDWLQGSDRPGEALLDALRDAHAAGARLVGMCSGVFVLAATGLLDGRAVTTHWAMADALAAAYPGLQVKPDQLYLDEGDVLTAGGGAAGFDVGLHLIRTSFGAEVANRLARYIVFAPHRAGGQAQYIHNPVPELAPGDPIAGALQWALENLDKPLGAPELARRAGMSRRQFDRRFRAHTGTTPAAWFVHQRVLRAQQMLETSELAVDAVARRCGFASAATLRPHFHRIVGVSPSAYRATFSRTS